MEYIPRYPQPFTLSEVTGLDVSVITEEIARLQNSLSHLRSTQEQLREANEESPDPDFAKAIEENNVTIGSQEERISILRMALAEKGIPTGGHYALDSGALVAQQQPSSRDILAATPRVAPSEPLSRPSQLEALEQVSSAVPSSEDIEMDEDGGLHL